MNKKNLSAKLKIAIVVPLQSPYLTSRLKKLISICDFNIILLLENAESKNRPGWNVEPIENIKLEILKSKLFTIKRENKDLGYTVNDTRMMPWKLPFSLWKNRPNIVLVCNATQLLFAIPLRNILGYKIGLNVEDTLHSTRNLGRIALFIKKWTYRQANFFLAYSGMAEKFLASINITEQVHKTSWSVELTEFKPDTAIREIFRKKNSVSEKIVFLFSGGLIPGKGIMPLLRAWSCLSTLERNMSSLLIAGSGTQELEAKKYVAEHALTEVKFLGQLNYIEMRTAFTSSDIFILPTLQDLYSLVVLEAMACGCPVLTTPYNGASELVTNEETGWLFDVAKEESIIAALQQVICHRDSLQQMGKKARERVLEMDNKIVMKNMADIINMYSPL